MAKSPEAISSREFHQPMGRRQLFKRICVATILGGAAVGGVTTATMPELSVDGKRLQKVQQRAGQRITEIQDDLEIVSQPELQQTLVNEKTLWEQQRDEAAQALQPELTEKQPSTDQHHLILRVSLGAVLLAMIGGVATLDKTNK